MKLNQSQPVYDSISWYFSFFVFPRYQWPLVKVNCSLGRLRTTGCVAQFTGFLPSYDDAERVVGVT